MEDKDYFPFEDDNWDENENMFEELKIELKDCVENNAFSTYYQTVDELKDICETYKKFNTITDYDVRWDNNNMIDVYLNPINNESINLNINIQ